jgi:four helix bundle protein
MKVKSYRDLMVWMAAMQLAEDIYQVTEAFPAREQFGLTSQLRRAAVSVPSNIAEGHARDSAREFLRFLSVAQGSLAEMETQLELSGRLGLVTAEDRQSLFADASELGACSPGCEPRC